jgi:3',5'-cyclic AMP phosphodiesterase CpdA
MQRKRSTFLARAAMTLLLGLLTVSMAWADEPGHKIVVIADPHVMDNGLLTNTSNADWTTYIAGSRKLIDYSKTLFDQAVSDIEDLWPKLVLIVGDLTKDGEQASHNYVKGKLDYLKNLGIPTLVIPGNHDLGTADAKVYGETTSAAPVIGPAAAFASLYADYGYGASSDRLENTLTYACEPIEGLVVIGIDSGTDGVLSDATLNWVCAKATAARAAGKQVIAMMHHPLIPHITGGDMFVETVSVANYETVRNRLADAGITTIFTGHFHTSDIAKDWNADKSKTIYDINTGSLCSYPCDYRVVTLSEDMNEMSIETRNATGDNTISADDAKSRLKTSMASIITAKLTAAGYGALASSVASKLADAYVFHAEGNENLSTGENSAESCLTSLQAVLSSAYSFHFISEEQYNSFCALISSMLQDKSNYGTDREDQTNDRELNVSMPVSVTPVDIRYYDPTAAMGRQRKTATDALAITNSTTTIGTADTETWYYVSGKVTNTNRIEVSGTVNLILEDGCNFNVKTGIHVASGNALNIYAQSVANRGSLTADNYALPNYAAIGGNGGISQQGNGTSGEAAGDITIYGGNITTTNGNIGGGDGGNGAMEPGEPNEPGCGGKGGNGNVTIYSGYIRVNGNIGGGKAGKGQNESGSDDEYYYGSNGSGTVYLSWTNTEDWICADNYYGTVTLQKDFNGFAKGEVSNNNDINGATLMYAGKYYIVTIGDMPEGMTATADLELNAGFKNAVEGQVVTIGFSGVPAGKVPVISATYGDNNYEVFEIIDNGDGTFSFKMPAGNVTVTASELKKDIKSCTAEVPDQLPNGNSLMYYKFDNANNGYAVIGETVKEGETTLALGTDYKFGSVTYVNGDLDPYKVGDECLVEIVGIGNYGGSKYVRFDIVNPSGSGTWGSLSWALEDGTLTISGSGDMTKPQNNGTYPWLTYKNYIETITIGEKVTSVADGAFATAQNDYHYAVSTVNLPSTLESIGEDAFAYCTGATITIPASVTSIADGAFKEVLKVESSLYDNADNTGMISLLAEAKKNDVTLQGRTLWKDGEWNTICLPFDMDAAQVTAQLGPDALKELDVEGYYNVTTGNPWPGNTGYDGYRQTGFDATSGTLYLYFKDATSIEAGKPYLIKWDKGDNLKDPEFTDVKVWDYAPATKAVTSDDKNVTFKGTYTSTTFTEDDNTKLFVGTDNKLNYPKIGARIGAFRAYFQLSEELRVKSEESPVKEFRLNFGEDSETSMNEELRVKSEESDAVYDLSGRRINSQFSTLNSQLPKGIYIVNGKKIFIK